MRIGFFFADLPSIAYNSSYWRCEVPFRALKAAGHQAVLMPKSALPSATGLDLVIIEREIVPAVLPVIERLQKEGAKVVISFDDAYHCIPKSHKWGYNYWQRNLDWHEKLLPFPTFKTFTEGLSLADGFITPSLKLTDYYKQYNDKGFFVDNFVDEVWLNEPVPEPDYDVGWSASMGHHDALQDSGLLKLFNSPKWKRSLLINCSNADMLQELQGHYATFVPWTKQGRYIQDAVAKFRVGLAPVASEYDQFRSQVKALGYAAAGRPAVMSESSTFRFSPGVHVKNTEQGWRDGIEEALSNYPVVSQNAKEWARTLTMQANLNRYTDLLDLLS